MKRCLCLNRERGQVLVKIEAFGVCHTDLHAAQGDGPVSPRPPFIPGHEGAGVIAAVGRGARDVKEGDRVGVPWLPSAFGHCVYCQGGWETLCESQQNSGYSVNGAFASNCLAPAAYVARLPENVSFADAAPVLCAGVTTYKGLKQTEAKPGQWVVFPGIGGLGHMALQYAKAMGLHVAAVDVVDDKLALARQLGAELTANAKSEDAAAKIRKEIGGAHGVLVTAVSPTAFRQAVNMLQRGGKMLVVGLPPSEFPLPIFDVVLNGPTIRGSIVGTRFDIAEALAFAADGKVKAHYQLEPLENINSIFDRMKRGSIDGRIVMTME